MAWQWAGNKPLTWQWWPSLLMHICITRPQWINQLWTRTPAFWGYPCRLMITHTIESYWIPSQIYKFKKFAKISNMKWIWWVLLKIQSGHDSVHKRTDGQGDTSIPPFQLRWSGGYNSISDGTKANHNESQQSMSNNHDKMMHFIQYFPMIMHIIDALLCFGVLRCLPCLPIFVRFTSQALGQSYDCPSANEVNLTK